MQIGIDFDNTIVCYDGVFHMAAVERGLVSADADIARDKTGVRNYLRGIGREDAWTELQGYVYGARMDLARLYPGVVGFIRAAAASGHTVSVISHKTKTPFLGPKYDLHLAAQRFLEMQKLVDTSGAGIPPEHVFFELTLEDKLARILSQACDIFIDDLPEFLSRADFPPAARRILFDPDGHHSGHAVGGLRLESYRDWASIGTAVLERQPS